MNPNETPVESLTRELKEELGARSKSTFINWFPGTASWKGQDFAVLNHAYLVDLIGKITLNKENQIFDFVPISRIDPAKIAFDSNKNIISFVKTHFNFDIARIKELITQLDPTETVKEQSIYKAVLNGHVKTIYDGDKLIGMGWIFPRQTALRKQAVVEDMIVDKNYRGKGFGKKIILDLIKWAKEQDIEVIELTTNPARTAANKLYKKVGFILHHTNHYLYRISS